MVQAARKHFSAQGYAATTMQQVAKSADTSIGNLYFYFSNKEELLLAVVDDFVREIAIRIDDAKSTFDEGPEQMAAGVYAAVLAALANHRLVSLILMSDGTHSLRQRVLDFFASQLIEFLREHADEVPETQHALAAYAWEGAIFNVLEQQLAGRLIVEELELARFLALWNLRGLGYEQSQADALVEAVEARLRKRLSLGEETMRFAQS